MDPETLSFGWARKPVADPSDPFVGVKDLPAYGIRYHINHLRRLWTRGDFPKPTHLSARKLVWRRSTIAAWIEAKTSGEGAA